MKKGANNIGLDIIEVSRFISIEKTKSRHVLKKIFSNYEISHCLKYKEPAPHFAGIFAAKEAVSKALGTKKFPFPMLEIRHSKIGAPEVWKKDKKLSVRVSISHTKSLAAAVALS